MKASYDPNLLSELVDQSHNPPGGDKVLGKFYAAIVEQIERGGNLAKMLIEVKKKRPTITSKHLTNLIFRSFQAIKFKQNDLSFRNFLTLKKWHKELDAIFLNPTTKSYFKKLLLTKSTTTTIYQRYAAPAALISFLFDGTPVTVADLGSGGNYGLRGIELNIPFKKVTDLTTKKLFLKLLSQKINLKKGLAVDKDNPDEPEAKKWRLACSFYPQELKLRDEIEQFENRIMQAKKVEFLKANLLNSFLPEKYFDVVILSTTLYQFNLFEQRRILENAKRLLTSEGFIIVQDFAAKSLSNPSHLDFSESWFGQPFSYGTFIVGKKTHWMFLEIFRWNNGRCQTVKEGEDFMLVFKKFYANSAKAALAHSTSCKTSVDPPTPTPPTS